MSKKPILVLGTEKGFGNYIGEMLKTEGYNAYEIKMLSNWDFKKDALQEYDIVVLGEMSLNPPQIKVLEQYVKDWGCLIAFRPCKELSGIFGIIPAGGILTDSYMKINSGTYIGKAFSNETMQFHGEADLYDIAAALEIATLYVNDNESANKPAVTISKYGHGWAAAFAYNLPKSIALTRQGNPEMAGIEGDGIYGLRAMDLFAGGWVDGTKNHLNQADVQMRLFTRCIELMSEYKKPLPHFWYFPGVIKSIIILTNDGENSSEEQFDAQFADVESKGAYMSLYVKELDLLSPEKVKALVERGHEISGHPDDTSEAASPTWGNMDRVLGNMVGNIRTKYRQPMETNVNHWFVWTGNGPDGNQDFTAAAKLEEKYGIRMDLNYAHYDNNAANNHTLGSAGNFTGSGLPMRFSDMNGKIVNVYQVINNVYDQQYMEKNDAEGFFECFKAILDRSIYSEVYSCVHIKAHNDEWHWSREPIMKMLDYANEKGIPVWTAKKLLDFLLMRDMAEFDDFFWNNGILRFTIDVPLKGEGLTFMMPVEWNGFILRKVFIDKCSPYFSADKIKEKGYAFLTVRGGSKYNVEAVYENEGHNHSWDGSSCNRNS